MAHHRVAMHSSCWTTWTRAQRLVTWLWLTKKRLVNTSDGQFDQPPSKFDLLFPNALYGLFTRYICEINKRILKHSSILAHHVITYSRDELSHTALFHVWSCLTLFCLFVSLLEMDHRFMHTCSSLSHSSCCLVGLSPQVGHSTRKLFSTCYLLVFPVHITFIRWNLWSRVTIPTDCWSFTVYLYEGTGQFSPVAAGRFQKRIYQQSSFPQPNRIQQKCSGTCPGWKCQICWISTYTLAHKRSNPLEV